ncbi:disease resistance protein RGA4-like [Triticum dicoccoides]|uniref:disease resistance protein RGA4-like n=1 Tax=Triticum dicoccoides TaxID=85692 RepID=UPI000E7A8136|nr:disease resistance protein RGA4-like [Triticum dicoccoides]
MEFGVAAFGAIVSVALTKLCSVKEKKLKSDAILISNKLQMITAIMKDHDRKGGRSSWVQIGLIAQLRLLAYDIEDSVDCFHANKTNTEDFATQIRELKIRSEDMRAEIMALAATQICLGQSIQDDVVPTQRLNPPGNVNCLLYFCLFPHNHHVRTKPLVRRWLAEGLVQREKDAVTNLKMFIKSSIISSTQTSNNGKVRRCQPTDLMLPYISQQSMSEYSILFCDGAAQQLLAEPSQAEWLQAQAARRLSVHPAANGELNLPQDLSRLRTLAVFPGKEANLASYEAVLDFSKYKVLRVLDLKECADMSEEHLRDIWSQVLMKYLSINSGTVDRIGRDIGYLDQLETLDLSGSEKVMVFKEVLLLPKLKHLLGKFQLSRRDTLSVPVLGWFESGLEKFLREKSVLETLAGFVTDGRAGFPQLMRCMRMLRKVKIWCKSDASEENLDAISKTITKFIRDATADPLRGRSLSIDFVECPRHFVNTINSHDSKGILASLKLCGKLSEFPKFVAQLSVIKELCLCLTGLTWDVIRDGLADVRGLKYLKLIEDNLGSIDILSEADHLKAIKRIYIVCKQMLKVAIAAVPLPNLVSVHILCQDLHAIPGTSGIEITNMKKLEEVALHPNLNRAISTELQQAAKGHDNKPKVSFIDYPQ